MEKAKRKKLGRRILSVALAVALAGLLQAIPGTVRTVYAADDITVTIDTQAQVKLQDADGDGCSICDLEGKVVGAFTVAGGTQGTDYTYGGGQLWIKTGTPLTIRNTDPETPTTDRIYVGSNVSANITLAGVNIDTSQTGDCAFEIEKSSSGIVTITLADDTTNTLKSGEKYAGLQWMYYGDVTPSGKLIIQGEQNGNGSLTATGGASGAGIGSQGNDNYFTSKITIRGGIVTATGGMYAAGIGGGGHNDDYGNAGGAGTYIEISGGTVTANGGQYAAGIGGGYRRANPAAAYGSNITISGGTVTATGGFKAAGIGGGSSSSYSFAETKVGGAGTNIRISGGVVTATGGSSAAGIGGGDKAAGTNITISGGVVTAKGGSNAAGIGGGNNGAGTDIKISGGTVTTTGGNLGAGIGGGFSGTGSNIVITGGSVKAVAGDSANAFGGGKNQSAVIPTTDGNPKENVYLLTIENPNSEAVTIDSAAYAPKNHTAADANDTNLYVYLTGEEHSVTVGETTVDYVYDDGLFFSKNQEIIRGFTVTAVQEPLVEGVDYDYGPAGILEIKSGKPVHIANVNSDTPTTDRIYVESGVSANITLGGVNIDTSQTEDCAFRIEDNSTGTVTITLADDTTNTLKSGNNFAGLQKSGTEGSLVIQGEEKGTGSLTASGGQYGAGIGGNKLQAGSSITISGGVVTATGGERGAGIGGGAGGNGTNITISGGVVTAQGYTDEAAGIGGGGTVNSSNDAGTGGNIIISGGSVTANGFNSFGGGRWKEFVRPTAADGTTPVYRLALTVDGTSAVEINGSTNYPKKHLDVNKLYVYLPAKTVQAPNEVTIGDTTTKYTYDTTNSKWLTVVEAPEADDTEFTYNGKEQTYTLAESDYYTISGNKQTEPGTYIVTVALKENCVWNDGTTDDKEYAFTIDDGYQISNANDLMEFARLVNEGQTAINAMLTADIAMNGIDWTIMSSFAGTFDGNGYTISGLNGHKADTGDTHGFIRTLADGGVVKNLTFTEANVMNHEGSGAISAVIVYTNNGTVENCVVKDSLIQHGNYDALGVVVGVNVRIIRNCASISNTMKRRFSSTKDVCGFVWSNSGRIENCFNYDCTYQNGTNRYAFTQSNSGTITNCYYYESSETLSDAIATDVIEAKSAAFDSGEVAYLLNGSKSTGTLAWYQTLSGNSADEYPVLDSEHGTVYSIFACDGTTPAGYSNENKNKSHADENKDGYCDVCKTKMDGISATLAGHSVSLGGQIGMNFYMDLDDSVLADGEAHMLFTLPDGSIQSVAVNGGKTENIGGKTYYVFTCNVAAKDMAGIITAKLVCGDGNGGTVEGTEYTYSVQKYAEALIDSNSATSEQKALAKAMLNYGAYAQKYFDPNVAPEKLANEGCAYEAGEFTVTTSGMKNYVPTVTDNSATLDYVGSTLILEADIKVRHYFKLKDGQTYSGNLQQYTAPDGETVEGTYYFFDKTFVAAKLGDMTQYTVEGIDFKYCPLSYVTTVLAKKDAELVNEFSDLENDTALQNLMKALYLYYKATVAPNNQS